MKTLDRDALYSALDFARATRGLTWEQVAEDTGVPASSLSRLKDGHGLSGDNLLNLLRWSGVDARPFLINGEQGLLSKEDQYTATILSIHEVLAADVNLTLEQSNTLAEVVRLVYAQMTGFS